MNTVHHRRRQHASLEIYNGEPGPRRHRQKPACFVVCSTTRTRRMSLDASHTHGSSPAHCKKPYLYSGVSISSFSAGGKWMHPRLWPISCVPVQFARHRAVEPKTNPLLQRRQRRYINMLVARFRRLVGELAVASLVVLWKQVCLAEPK